MDFGAKEKITPAQFVVIALTALAPILGGSTSLWAQATMACATGLLFLFAPARRWLGILPSLAITGLLALALIEFLPAHWFPGPPWRAELVRRGAQLPYTVSAQPWLSLESVLLLLLGLTWTYYLLSLDWTWEARETAWRCMAATVVILAATLTISFLLHKRVPFWPEAPEYGFFPNRNHTSNVLGLGGVLVYALAFRSFDQERRHWWIWLPGFALICVALVLNYSRAGLILLCGGVFAWHLYWWTASRHRRRPLIASGMIVLVLALLAWSGGKTAMRFVGEETTQLLSLSENGRVQIYRDAFDLSAKSPVTGVGLNNFGSVFATNQRLSVAEDVAVHPESDWLWSTLEMGWLAPLLIAMVLCWWVSRCFPFEPRSCRLIRMAGFICGCGFAVHALLDVPGHRVGAFWPALLLAVLAVNPRRLILSPSRAVTVIFRAVGIILIAVGGWWFASVSGANAWPTSATLNRAFSQIEQASETEDYATVLNRASQALNIAPLNWELNFKRGFAEGALHRPAEMQRDFAVARYLLPNWPDLYLKQGTVCLDMGEPDLAFDIWREGMQRLRNPAGLYSDIYPAIKDDAELRDRWRHLAENNSACVLIFLQNATPTEFQIELGRVLEENPDLHGFTPVQLQRLFQTWYDRGDKLALAETLRTHPDWQQIAWRELARVYADYQDYRPAYEALMRFANTQVSNASPNEPLDSLAIRFRISGSENDGLSLAQAEAVRGQVDDALAIITVLASRPNPSPLVNYVEAQLWAQKENWPKAWQAMSRYVEQLKRDQ